MVAINLRSLGSKSTTSARFPASIVPRSARPAADAGFF